MSHHLAKHNAFELANVPGSELYRFRDYNVRPVLLGPERKIVYLPVGIHLIHQVRVVEPSIIDSCETTRPRFYIMKRMRIDYD